MNPLSTASPHTHNTEDTHPPYDLLLVGGRVIDPASGLDARRDLAIRAGRIAALAPELPRAAAQVVDVSGLLVTPGLIDMHVHVAPPFDISVMADAHSFPSGVTTMVDAGSSGPHNFTTFKQQVIDQAKTRVLAYLNVVDVGMGTDVEQDVSRMRPCSTAEVAAAYPQQIVGIKVAHYWTHQRWDARHAPWDNVERGVQAGEMCGLPVMVDFWPRPPERSYVDLILHKLRPGDIHTHVYAQQFPIVDAEGRLNPVLLEARQRGIIFDLGHGAASFWFRNAEPAIAQGFLPDSISTDLHRNSIPTAGSLLQVMSKLLNLGLSLPQVIERVTVAPAREIGHPELGTLTVSAEADVAVLALHEGDYGYIDCGRAKISGRQALTCALTLRAGRVVHDPGGLTMPLWREAPPDYWRIRREMTLPLKKEQEREAP